MVSNTLKAEADRRATLMLGRPCDHFRYLSVSVTDCVKHSHNESDFQAPVPAEGLQSNLQKKKKAIALKLSPKKVIALKLSPKKKAIAPKLSPKKKAIASKLSLEKNIAPKLSPEKFQIKPWWCKSKTVDGVLTPAPVYAKEIDSSTNNAIPSPINMETSCSDVFSRSKELDDLEVLQESSCPAPCKPIALKEPVCTKLTGVNSMGKKNKHSEKKLKTGRSSKHLLKVSANLSMGNHRSVERRSKMSVNSATRSYGKTMKHPTAGPTLHSSVITANSDLAASIPSPENTSDTRARSTAATVDTGSTSLVFSSSPEADEESHNSSVQILEIVSDNTERSQVTDSLNVEVPSLSSAEVPPIHRPKKAKPIKLLSAFQDFKKSFPCFAHDLEDFEQFLLFDRANVSGSAGNVPKNIFAVVSFFVHETRVNEDFGWELICLNLTQMIQIYITKHSTIMSIKTLKRLVKKAFCKLSSYLFVQHLVSQSQFLPSFSKMAFNRNVLDVLDQIPDNNVLPKSPTKHKMAKELLQQQCTDSDEKTVKAEMRSSPLNQVTAKEASEPPCSDIDETYVKDEVNSLPSNQEVDPNTPITPTDNLAVDMLTPYPFGMTSKAKQKDFFYFRFQFPGFIAKLQEYKAYLENDSAYNSATANKIVKNILNVVSSYVSETSVTEDLDWKFICYNIHKIVENYYEKHYQILSNAIIRMRLNEFQKLSSYIQHLQTRNKSNFLPFFSVDIFKDVVSNVTQRLPYKSANTSVCKTPKRKLLTPNLPSPLLKNCNVNLQKIYDVLVSDYVLDTLDGAVTFGIAMEPLASQNFLIGMAPLPDNQTPLLPSFETACRVQAVLMFIGCLRNSCQSSKLSALTLNDFSKPMWIDSHSALFRSRAYEEVHSHPSYTWWTSAELRVLQYYLLHYRHHISGSSDPKSPLFLSPSLSTESLGCVLESGEVRNIFDTVLKKMGSGIDVSHLQSHQLRYVYFSEMQKSGLTQEQMSDLAWSLGHIDAHPVTSATIHMLRKCVKRSILQVENIFSQRISHQRNETLEMRGNYFSFPRFYDTYPSLCSRTKLVAAHRHVLSKLNLRFPSLPSSKQLLFTPSEIRSMKSSHHKKKKREHASHHGNCEDPWMHLDLPTVSSKRKRDATADEMSTGCKRSRPGARQTGLGNTLALDVTKRIAVLDWLDKMPYTSSTKAV